MIALAIVLAIVTLCGLILVVAGWMAMTRKLPPNPLAGIRTPYTYSSPEAWYATHEAAGPVLVLGGAAVLAIGLALLPFALADKLSAAVVAIGLLIQALIAAIAAIGSWLYGVRRAKAKLESSPAPMRANGAPNAS